MSDELKSIYVQQKHGLIELNNKPGFQSCYDINSLILKESDGEGSSIALTVHDSFDTCDTNDEEWVTQRPDTVSCIDFYAVNGNEIEDNGIRFSKDLTSTDIEGYCVINNCGQLHTVITRNITNELQPVSEVLKTDYLNNDSLNVLQCPQQIIAVCTSDDACNPSPVHNISSRPMRLESLDEEVNICSEQYKQLISNDSLNDSEYKPFRVTKGFDLVNLSKSISALSKTINRPRSITNKSKLSGLPFIKLPKKYILSGKIISQNMLPLVKNRNQMFFASKSIDVKKKTSSVLYTNQKYKKGRSILKCNGIKPKVSFQENEVCDSKHTNKQVEVPTDCLNEIKYVDGSVSDPKTNIVTKKINSPLAVVAISTNKSDDTTEIVIKTEKGEELYKGKTSEMMKAIKNNLYKSTLFDTICDSSKNTVGNSEDDHIAQALKSIGVDKHSYEQIETKSGQMIYVCPVEKCGNVCDKIHTMNIHILSHYNIRPFKCDFDGCAWSFYSKFRLKRHKETHLKIKHFKCTYKSCDRMFTTIYNLNTHLKRHERPAVLKCTVDGCEETFQTKRSLEIHLKSHGKIHAPYMCEIEGCGKCYYSVNSLHSHSRSHKYNIEELRCEYCYKIFDKPCRLKAHLRAHTGIKPYKCTFKDCDWAFTTSSKLRRHEHKHTQVRKFTCNYCNKSFLRGEHLKDHCLKHFVCNSFLCPISGCGLSFKNRSSLYAHMKKRHHSTSDSSVNKPDFSDNWLVTLISSENGGLVKDSAHSQTSGPSDTNSLDSIEMLSEDNLMSTMESLHYNNEVDVIRSASGASTGLSFNGMNTEGLLVGLPELINNYTPQLDQDYNATTMHCQTLVRHLVVAECKESDSLDIPNSFEPEAAPLSLRNVKCIGSARTGLTYQQILQDRERRKSKKTKKPTQTVRKRLTSLNTSDNVSTKASVCLSSPSKEHLGLRVASDVVLSTGLLGGSQDNLTRSLLLQDELSSGDLYGRSQVQEETILLGSSGDLLCEDTPPKHSEFEQSTINLRDLD